MHLKDDLMPRYAELIYNGFWFAPERADAAGADRQEPGERHGHRAAEAATRAMPRVVGRKSPNSLYRLAHVTFEEDAGAYDQRDAAGFIKLNALRLTACETGPK